MKEVKIMHDHIPFTKTQERSLFERVGLVILVVLFFIFAFLYLEIETPEKLTHFHWTWH